MRSVVWGEDRLWAVGDSGGVYSSSNGTAWTLGVPSTTQPLWSAAFNGTRVAAVGDSGKIVTALSTWGGRASGTTRNLSSIAWVNDHFLVTGDSGTVLTSTDGISWTQIPASGLWFPAFATAFTGTHYVTVGYSGQIFTSMVDEVTIADVKPAKKIQLTSRVLGSNLLVSVPPTFFASASARLSLWNVFGKKIMELPISPDYRETSLPILSLANGMYWVQFKQGKTLLRHRVIISR
jgi:hypothetical protein